MEVKEINYQGKRLSYRTKGSGPVIVLLHGFGEDSAIWKNQFHNFPHHQLIVPDLPGSGKSEMINDMSMEGIADAVKAMITHETPAPLPPEGGVANTQSQLKQKTDSNENISQESGHSAVDIPPSGGRGAGVILIGHSMGGYITLAFAEKYPGSLIAFGLFHSTAFADSEEKKQTRKKGIDFIRQHGVAAFLKTSIPNLYAPQTKEQHPECVEEHLRTIHNFSGDALVSYYAAMIQRPDRTNVLKESKVPVLFVVGKYDTAIPFQDSLKQCHLPKVSHVHVFDHAGHMGMIEALNESNKILSQFVNSIANTVWTE